MVIQASSRSGLLSAMAGFPASPRTHVNEETPGEIRPWELGRLWNYTPGTEVTVVCYTNLDTAELFVNGSGFGPKDRDSSLEYITWRVPFERGEIEARGKEVLDEQGRLCATERVPVEVAVSGGIKFLGMENGDIADCTEYPSSRRETFHGRLIIYALVPAGSTEPTRLEASAEGLPKAAIEIFNGRFGGPKALQRGCGGGAPALST